MEMRLRDKNGRAINYNTIVYIGETENGISTDEFKEKYRGRTPKNGYHVKIQDLLYMGDRSYINEVNSMLPRFSDISDEFKTLNSGYYGMQFIKSKIRNKQFYIFFMKEENIKMFSYIKKGRISFSVIDEILEMHGYKNVFSLLDPIDHTKDINMYFSKTNNMIVSVKTDTRLYNVINILYVNKVEDEYVLESSTKTTMIMLPNNDLIPYNECNIDTLILQNITNYRDKSIRDLFLINEDLHSFIDEKMFFLRSIDELLLHLNSST